MKGTDLALFVSAALVALPALYSAGCILNARYKHGSAKRRERGLGRLEGQAYQSEVAAIERLKDDASDLTNFNSLVPTWAMVSGIGGIILNLVARLGVLLA